MAVRSDAEGGRSVNGSRLAVVRHAPVGAEGLCYGRTDVPATLSARDAARVVAERLPWRPAAIWSSPAARCATVAHHLAGVLDVRATVDPRLHELDYGEWEGRSWREIEAADGARLRAWTADWVRARPPGGESAADLERRVRGWLGDVGREPACVITHAGVIRALRVVLEETSWRDAMARGVPYLEPLVLTT